MLHFSIPLDDLDGKIFGHSPIATTTTSTTTTPSPSTTTKTTTTSGPYPTFNESKAKTDCTIPYPVLMNLVALNTVRGSRITIDDMDTTQSSSKNPTPGFAQTSPIHLSMTSNFWEVAAATGLTSFIGLLINLIIFCCVFRARACARRRPSKFIRLTLKLFLTFISLDSAVGRTIRVLCGTPPPPPTCSSSDKLAIIVNRLSVIDRRVLQ